MSQVKCRNFTVSGPLLITLLQICLAVFLHPEYVLQQEVLPVNSFLWPERSLFFPQNKFPLILNLTSASSLRKSLLLTLEKTTNNWSLSTFHGNDSLCPPRKPTKSQQKKLHSTRSWVFHQEDGVIMLQLSIRRLVSVFRSSLIHSGFILWFHTCYFYKTIDPSVTTTVSLSKPLLPWQKFTSLAARLSQDFMDDRTILAIPEHFQISAANPRFRSSPLSSLALIPCLSPSWFRTSIMRIFIRSILQAICWFIVLELQTNGIIFPARSSLRIQHWFPSIVGLLDWHFWLIRTL